MCASFEIYTTESSAPSHYLMVESNPNEIPVNVNLTSLADGYLKISADKNNYI